MFDARLRNLRGGKQRKRKRERDVSVTRERFGMFIFLENTRPSLGTRGNWKWAAEVSTVAQILYIA